MLKLAFKLLGYDKQKTLFTVLALAAVISVILILEGFEQGQYTQLEQVVLNRNADLIAAQSGVENFIATRSVIPQLSRIDVEAVEGVKQAHPITALPIIYKKDNLRTPVYIIVYDSSGGPSELLEGRAFQYGSNIVIDKSLSEKYGLKIDDEFVVNEFKFTISGITNESAFMMPFAFINYDGMIDLFLESDIAPDLSTFPLLSFLLVELKPNADKQQVIRMLEASVPSVDVHTTEEIAKNDIVLGRTFFEPIMGVLVSVGYVIGLLVVGLIMYSDISASRKSYAVLKAIGFPIKKLFRMVVLQSSLLILMAIPIGTLLALISAMSIEMSEPIYLIEIVNTTVYYQTLGACLAFALVSGLFPLVIINRSDPMLAFQSS